MNREANYAKVKAWRKAHPERARRNDIIGVHKRRARLRNAEGTFTAADLDHLLASQNSRCFYCQTDLSEGFTVDHLLPLSRGGSNWPANLALACVSCNAQKGDKTVEEFQQYRRTVTSGHPVRAL